MAIFKCKMCGGTLEINNETVAVCEYCGTKQTLPSNKDEIVNNLFNRANNLRIKSEFDRAEEVYQTIIKENSQESEAYWGLILCKYGIEYVDDPKTHTRVPTCHRTSYDAIMTDADYLAAVEYADASQKIVYEEEAKAIDAVQKNILSVVKNEKPFDVTLIREEIKTRSVKSEVKDDSVLYIRIGSFSENVDDDVKKAFENETKNRKTPLKGIVLDVRNNPGGLLDQAIAVSSLFLDQGEVVSTRARNEEDTVKYSAKGRDITNGLPVVVLINNGSASASEIVAGALQDHKRAVIMGEKSFGKGSVQTVVPLGSYGAMRLTTARYYTPSGKSIQATGIEPDIVVHPAKVEEFTDEYGFTEAEYTNALKNETVDNKKTKDKKDDKDNDWRKDYQLSRAVDLVKALSVYKAGK